jgi:hypothetical protein
MTVKCPCGSRCPGYDPGVVSGGIPEYYVSVSQKRLPLEMRRLMSNADQLIADVGGSVAKDINYGDLSMSQLRKQSLLYEHN